MKKIVCGLLLSSLLLTGCFNKKEENKVSKTVTTTTVSKSTSKTTKPSSKAKDSSSSTEKISGSGTTQPSSASSEAPANENQNDAAAAASIENPDMWTIATTYAAKVTGIDNNKEAALPIYDSLKNNGAPYANDNWPTEVNYSSDLGRVAAIGSPMYDLNMGTNFSGKNPEGEFASATDIKVTTAGSYQVAPTIDTAIGILAEQNGNNPDYNYTDMGTGADGKGTYREIKVTSQSAQAQGEAGTVARTKVYGDGSTADAY